MASHTWSQVGSGMSSIHEGSKVTAHQLRRAGFFRELPHGDPDGPTVLDQAHLNVVDKVRVHRYLTTAPVVAREPRVVTDALDPSATIGSVDIRSDGVWVWPSDLAWYVGHHEAALPAEFVTHMAASGWTAPTQVSVEVSDVLPDVHLDTGEQTAPEIRTTNPRGNGEESHT